MSLNDQPEPVDPELSLAAILLTQLQRQRIFCIRSQSRCDRSMDAYTARVLGFHVGLEPVERKRLFARASAIRRAIERGDEDHYDREPQGESVLVAANVPTMIIVSAAARAAWDDMRTRIELDMCNLAATLPVASFAEATRGLSNLGLAVIVGEAGDLAKYSTVAKFWKRMGLALVDGKRQGNPGANATAEDWIKHGYNRARRAEVWAFVDDLIIRAQWRGDRDHEGKDPKKTKKPVAVPAHAIGPYGEDYGRKKAEYLSRDWTAAHADKAARRYVAKRLLRDLWVAWRR